MGTPYYVLYQRAVLIDTSVPTIVAIETTAPKTVAIVFLLSYQSSLNVAVFVLFYLKLSM